MKRSKVFENTAMLYIMSIAKLIFPLLTLPYLTRVLSENAYGLVSYVKSCMAYMQLIVDFGFILSSVRDIVNANGDLRKIGCITGNTIIAKTFLAIVAGIILAVMCFVIPILSSNVLFVVLNFISIATTIFLLDFLFRGIEKMQYITMIYLISKTLSVFFTFVLVKSDSSILWIPVLDILANAVSIVITLFILRTLKISIRITGIKDCFVMIKESFTYFLSNMATTAFSALNTLLIGIYLTDLEKVAHWSLCLNIISSIQGLYAPICNGIYPYMIKEKKLSFIHKILLIFMPIVVVGCGFCFLAAKPVLYILGGEKYVEAYSLFRLMIPILFFSFPAQIYGWPTLGAVGLAKQTTISTVTASIIQIIGLILLIIFDEFTLNAVATLRGFTEATFMIIRMFFTYKNKKKFIFVEKEK